VQLGWAKQRNVTSSLSLAQIPFSLPFMQIATLVAISAIRLNIGYFMGALCVPLMAWGGLLRATSNEYANVRAQSCLGNGAGKLPAGRACALPL
jgi:hypothetical protein